MPRAKERLGLAGSKAWREAHSDSWHVGELMIDSNTAPRHGGSKQESTHLNGKARGVQCAPRALLMYDTCYSIELSSASMPLLLEETLRDEGMNRLINQVAV